MKESLWDDPPLPTFLCIEQEWSFLFNRRQPKVSANVSKILQEASRRVETTIQEVCLLGHKIMAVSELLHLEILHLVLGVSTFKQSQPQAML